MAPVCNAKGGLVDALVETSLEKTNLEDEQEPAQVVSARKSMTFERLPSEILLKIVSKLPFRDDGLADVENLKKACTRARILIEENECSLTKAISSELFPIYALAFPFKACGFALVPAINALEIQVQELLHSGRRCAALLKSNSIPESATGYTFATYGWEKVVTTGLMFFQLLLSHCHDLLRVWNQAHVKFSRRAWLIVRFTSIFIFQLYEQAACSNSLDIRVGDGATFGSKARRGVLSALLWNGSLDLITARLSKGRIDTGNELEEDFLNLVKNQAEELGGGAMETLSCLFGCTHYWVWDHIEETYHISPANADPEGKDKVEKEVKILEKLLGEEMQGKTVLQMVEEMVGAFVKT